MDMRSTSSLAAVAVVLLSGVSGALAKAAHPVEFWQSIAQHDYAPPPGSDVSALTDELEGFLASPDPTFRDEIGYNTFVAWIYQKKLLDAAQVRALALRLVANLRLGIGERETDAVFRRSFSALVLSVIIARDNTEPFLGADEFGRIQDAAVAYLKDERDVRGYDPVKGWAHSAAHTADLLKFIARSAHVDTSGQASILNAIAVKLATSPVFTHGEDERLARALLSIVNRKDFDRAGFQGWLTRVRPARLPPHPSVEALSGAQNVKNLFSKLEVLLSLDQQPTEAVAFARDSVRAAVKDLY
jgi:hypothetical protein